MHAAHVWQDYYHGLLVTERHPDYNVSLYGYYWHQEQAQEQIIIDHSGHYFGFVLSGQIHLSQTDFPDSTVSAGQWFSRPHSLKITNARQDSATRLLIIHQDQHIGFASVGGPIESRGRLRYIDGCSDSLLVYPPRLGDPCLNHLHFPMHITQTMHQHPSTRMGAVFSGNGYYITRQNRLALRPGTIFYIPAETDHCFATDQDKLDVIAFHPDSDWGPQDDDHPMINRTWVNGKKIDQHTWS